MIFPDFSLTFPVSSKFPDFSLTGKCLLIFPGFPVRVGTLSTTKAVFACNVCIYIKVYHCITGDWHKSKRRGSVQTRCQAMMCRLMLTQTKKLVVNGPKYFDRKSLSRSLSIGACRSSLISNDNVLHYLLLLQESETPSMQGIWVWITSHLV